MTSDPILDGGRLYVATHQGYIYCLNKENGQKIWKHRADGSIVSVGAISETLVYFVDYSGKLLALDTLRGEEKWSFQGSPKSWISPVVYGKSLFLGGPDGLLYSLDTLTGEMNWKSNIGTNRIGGGTLNNELLYVSSSDDHLYKIDPGTGHILSEFDLGNGTYQNPLILTNLAYVADWDGHLYALDTKKGTLTWNLWTGGGLRRPPIAHNDNLYIGSSDGLVYSITDDSGTINWTAQIGDEVNEKLVYNDGLIYAVSKDGGEFTSDPYDDDITSRIVALDPDTGEFVWTYQSNTQIATSIVADESLLFVSQVDGTIRAIAKRNLAIKRKQLPSTSDIDSAYTPLSPQEAKSILDAVFWLGTTVLGASSNDVDSSGSKVTVPIDHSSEVLKIFETAFYLRMGDPAPERIKLKLLQNDEYQALTTNPHLMEAPAWCCIVDGSKLEMIVNGEYRFASVFGSIAHESGHAIHRINNPIAARKSSQESRALKESVAFAYETALLRTIGDYTGYNARNLPYEYEAVYNFNHQWKSWTEGINDLEEEHARGKILLWLALLEDPKLEEYKNEIETSITLSPDSLVNIANYFISKSRSDSTSYVKDLLQLETLLSHKEFIRSKIVIRNTSEPIDGLLRDDITAVYVP